MSSMLWTPVLAQAEEGGLAMVGLFYLAIIVILCISWWKLFEKAGEEGWKGLIPILNMYFLLKIVGRPGWWLLLFFIPIVSLVMSFILAFDVAKAYGRGGGTAVGLIFLPFIFYPILGFGSAQYQGTSMGTVGQVFD